MIIVPSMHGILGGGAAAAAAARPWPFAPFRKPTLNAAALGAMGALGAPATFTSADATLIFSTLNTPSDQLDAPLDLVGRGRGAKSATNLVIPAEGPLSAAGVFGKYVTASSTWRNCPLDLSPYNKIAISFWLWWDAFANDDAKCCEYGPNVNTAGQNTFNVNPNSATNTAFSIFMSTNGASGLASAWFTRPSAAAWHHYVFNIDRSQGSAPGCFTSTFLDGASQAISSSNLGSQSGNFTNSTTLHFMSRADASQFGSGRLAYFNIFNGNISAGQAQALYTTPWAMLRRRYDWT